MSVLRSGTNLPLVGSFNRSIILDAIRRSPGMSRVELARATGLTAQTVSNIVRSLLGTGLVTESGREPTPRGKPRTKLSINAGAQHALGVHLDPVTTVCVLVDFSGQVVERTRRSTPRTSTPAGAVTAVVRALSDLIKRSGVDPSTILGIGVAAPGPIDRSSGMVVDPPNLRGWHHVPLAAELTRRLGFPAVMDNDATAAAIGERWKGGDEHPGSFAFLYFGAGIGAGLILDEQVYRGSTGNAGEYGHLSVVPGGVNCFCGERGCLEAYCSATALVARAAETMGSDRRERHGITGGDPAAGLVALVEAAATDTDAAAILDEAAALVGTAAVMLVNLFDVELLVLGGQIPGPLKERYRTGIDVAVSTRTIARPVRSVAVELSRVGDDAAAVGAASLVFHDLYSPQIATLLHPHLKASVEAG